MSNETPLPTLLAIIEDWDYGQTFFPKLTRTEIAKRRGVCRDIVAKALVNREAILARQKWEAPRKESPPQISEQKAYTPAPKEGKLDIMLLPDAQVKPGIDLDHLAWAGRYAAAKKPDVIVNIGDFADMASCSFHDEPGSKSYSEQNYCDDILSVHYGMQALMKPIQEEMARSGWRPRLVLTLGNHEDRINRTIEKIPKLDGTIGLPDLEYERYGWEVIPYLVPIVINGVAFCHFFASGAMGRPIGSAQALLTKKHMSCVAGHQQGRSVAHAYHGDGREMTAIICGSFYRHDEKYMNHQSNKHYRGLYMLYGCEDGVIESPVAVTMAYLERTYS